MSDAIMPFARTTTQLSVSALRMTSPTYSATRCLTTQNVQKLVEDAQRELERQQQQNDLDKALKCVERDLREVDREM